MGIDPAFLDERNDRLRQASELADRDREQGDIRAWMNLENPPELRLARFDGWVRQQLDKRLEWGWAGAGKERRIEQCRIQLDTVVIGLFRRGWMLDGKRLADRITELLDAVGKAQRAGKVRDFFPYFKASVERYVGANAEELQAEAMSAGMAVGQVFQALTRALPKGPALPELIAQRRDETLREKVARQRRQDARKAADAGQIHLL